MSVPRNACDNCVIKVNSVKCDRQTENGKVVLTCVSFLMKIPQTYLFAGLWSSITGRYSGTFAGWWVLSCGCDYIIWWWYLQLYKHVRSRMRSFYTLTSKAITPFGFKNIRCKCFVSVHPDMCPFRCCPRCWWMWYLKKSYGTDLNVHWQKILLYCTPTPPPQNMSFILKYCCITRLLIQICLAWSKNNTAGPTVW